MVMYYTIPLQFKLSVMPTSTLMYHTLEIKYIVHTVNNPHTTYHFWFFFVCVRVFNDKTKILSLSVQFNLFVFFKGPG